MSEERKLRRAAERQALKLARKAGLPAPALATTTNISPAQLAANRGNAQLSSGPVSAAGRAVSSQNRLTHGLARHNGTFKLLPSEDPAAFEALEAGLISEHQPQTETESILIQAMAESHWLAQRAQTLQHTCFDPATGLIADPKMFALFLRYETTHRRAFHKSLADLLKLRAEKRKAQNGFEAQREFRAFHNPEFRADGIGLGMAYLNKDPDLTRLEAEFTRKYAP